MDSIYTYFKYPNEIIDIAWLTTTYKPVIDVFEKRWGKDVKCVNREDTVYDKELLKAFSLVEKNFKKRLDEVLEYYNIGYNKEEIINSYLTKNRLKKRLPNFKDEFELYDTFDINNEKLINALSMFNKKDAYLFANYYGISCNRKNIAELSKITKLEKIEIARSIYLTYRKLINVFKLDKKILLPNIKETKKTNEKLECFLDYFNEEDKDIAIYILEKCKRKNLKTYKSLMKFYDENYKIKEVFDRLDYNDSSNFYALKNNISYHISKIKSSDELEKFKNENLECFLDYFEKNEKDKVLKIISNYDNNSFYINSLKKMYDEKYILRVDHYYEVTKKDQENLKYFVATIKYEIRNKNINLEKQKRTKRKDNFLDYFDRSNVKIVLEILDYYKKLNTNGYKCFKKAYDDNLKLKEEYNTFTREEKVILTSFTEAVKKHLTKVLKTNGETFTSKKIKKDNFKEYFNEEDYDLLIELLKEYKKRNTLNYQSLMKMYDEDLNLKSDYRKNLEVIDYSRITAITNSLLNTIKKNNDKKNYNERDKYLLNFLDYFDEDIKEYVLIILDGYKNKSTKGYNVLKKIYEIDNYTMRDDFIKLETSEDATFLSFKNNLIKYALKLVANPDYKIRPQKKKSNFLDYFLEDDRILAVNFIENYPDKEAIGYKAYKAIVDENYNILNDKEDFTNYDDLCFYNFLANIRKRIAQYKIEQEVLKIKKENTMSDEELILKFSLTPKRLDYLYLRNLNYFEEDQEIILLDVIKNNNIAITEIISLTNLNEDFKNMNMDEKVDMVVRLEKIRNTKVDIEKIRKKLIVKEKTLKKTSI